MAYILVYHPPWNYHEAEIESKYFNNKFDNPVATGNAMVITKELYYNLHVEGEN